METQLVGDGRLGDSSLDPQIVKPKLPPHRHDVRTRGAHSRTPVAGLQSLQRLPLVVVARLAFGEDAEVGFDAVGNWSSAVAS